MPSTAAYVAAKGGLEAATRVWAVREARHGVLFNIVRLGFTEPPNPRAAPPTARQPCTHRTPHTIHTKGTDRPDAGSFDAISDPQVVRAQFEDAWSRWNLVRAATSTASLACLTWGAWRS